MSDIVERLRETADHEWIGHETMAVLREAADEIERLRKALQDVASTLDWQRVGSMEWRLRQVALAAINSSKAEDR